MPKDQSVTATAKPRRYQNSGVVMARYLQEKDCYASFLASQKHDGIEYLKEKTDDLERLMKEI